MKANVLRNTDTRKQQLRVVCRIVRSTWDTLSGFHRRGQLDYFGIEYRPFHPDQRFRDLPIHIQAKLYEAFNRMVLPKAQVAR